MIRTNDLTIGALGSALSAVLMMISAVIPSGKIAVAFVASLIPMVVYIECHKKITSVLCGVVSGIIVALLLPKSGLSSAISLVYCSLLCYYPYVKARIESIKKLIIEWIIKVAIFSIISLVLYFISSKLGLDIFEKKYIIILLIAAFSVYDIMLSYAITYYVNKISPIIRKARTK